MTSASSPLLPHVATGGGTKKKTSRLQLGTDSFKFFQEAGIDKFPAALALNILKSVRSDGHDEQDMTNFESDFEKSQDDISVGEMSDTSTSKKRRISFKVI